MDEDKNALELKLCKKVLYGDASRGPTMGSGSLAINSMRKKGSN